MGIAGSRPMLRPSALLASACVALAATAAAQDAALLADSARFMTQWCASCHGGEKPKAASTSPPFPAAFPDPDATLRKAAVRLRNGTMPPAKAPQPPRDDVAHLLRRVDAAFAAREPRGPGRVGIRRLSRYEYRCSIRDLLGVEVPAGGLPRGRRGIRLRQRRGRARRLAAAVREVRGGGRAGRGRGDPRGGPDAPARTRAIGSELFCTIKNSVRGSRRAPLQEGEATLELAAADGRLRPARPGLRGSGRRRAARACASPSTARAGGMKPALEASIEATKTRPRRARAPGAARPRHAQVLRRVHERLLPPETADPVEARPQPHRRVGRGRRPGRPRRAVGARTARSSPPTPAAPTPRRASARSSPPSSSAPGGVLRTRTSSAASSTRAGPRSRGTAASSAPCSSASAGDPRLAALPLPRRARPAGRHGRHRRAT